MHGRVSPSRWTTWLKKRCISSSPRFAAWRGNRNRKQEPSVRSGKSCRFGRFIASIPVYCKPGASCVDCFSIIAPQRAGGGFLLFLTRFDPRCGMTTNSLRKMTDFAPGATFLRGGGLRQNFVPLNCDGRAFAAVLPDKPDCLPDPFVSPRSIAFERLTQRDRSAPFRAVHVFPSPRICDPTVTFLGWNPSAGGVHDHPLADQCEHA